MPPWTAGCSVFDPPVEHLRERRDVGNVDDGQAGLSERLGGAAGRQQRHAAGVQGLRKGHETGLVGHAEQGAADGDGPWKRRRANG